MLPLSTKGSESPSAYVITAEVSQVMRGAQGVTGEQGKQGEQGIQGLPGKSAYQSYLDTTTDAPKLTEEQWAKQNDYIYQLIYALTYGIAEHP